MAVVETMPGPVDLGNLGQTLTHEHVQNYGSPVRYFTPAKGGAA